MRLKVVASGILLWCLGLLAGCTDPVEQIPEAKVEAVTAYGVTLDDQAKPEQVTYVLLRSLKDDVKASQEHRSDDQKTANLITWSISAPGEIERRLLETFRATAKDPSQYASLGKDRNKEIYRIVNLWASIVAYYVGSFDEDQAKAIARMRARVTGNLAHVYCDVWPEPPGNLSEFNQHQTLDVELSQEKGVDGKDYWRVGHVSFRAKARATTSPAGTVATRPATAPG